MVFVVPKELMEGSVLACSHCHNPVPNDLLPQAQHGQLGPCPVCGCELLTDNPFNAMTYAKSQEYPGLLGLLFVGEIFNYTNMIYYTPQINTETKRRNQPLVELLKSLIG